jgi:hypothetical protein
MIEVLINNQVADVSRNFRPKLNIVFDSFEYGKLVDGATANTLISNLVLPWTRNNQRIFFPNFLEVFDKWYDISISSRGGALFSGQCEVVQYSEPEKTITLNVVSGGYSFFRLIDTLSLKKLDLGVVQWNDNSRFNINSGTNRSFNASLNMYGYASWYQYGLKPNGLMPTFKDLKPHLYVNEVLKAICAKVGYRLLNNDFVNSTFFRSLVLPFGDKELKTTTGTFQANTINSNWFYSNQLDFAPLEKDRTEKQYANIEFWGVGFDGVSNDIIHHELVIQPYSLYSNVNETYSIFTFLQSGTYEVECNFTLTFVPQVDIIQSNSTVDEDVAISVIQLYGGGNANNGNAMGFYKSKNQSNLNTSSNNLVDYTNENDPVLVNLFNLKISNDVTGDQKSQPIKQTLNVLAGQFMIIKTSVSIIDLASPTVVDDQRFISDGGFIKITKTDTAQYGSLIELASTLKETGAKNFIKGLSELFCLVTRIDSSRKTFEIAPRFGGYVDFVKPNGTIGTEIISGHYKQDSTQPDNHYTLNNKFHLWNFYINDIVNRPKGLCKFALKPDKLVAQSFVEVDFDLSNDIGKPKEFANTLFEELHVGYTHTIDTVKPELLGVCLNEFKNNNTLPKPTFETTGFKIASVTSYSNKAYNYTVIENITESAIIGGFTGLDGIQTTTDMLHQYAVVDDNLRTDTVIQRIETNGRGVQETVQYRNMNYNFSFVDAPLLKFEVINDTVRLTNTGQTVKGFFEGFYNTFFATLKNNQQVECLIKIPYFVLKNLDTTLIYRTIIDHRAYGLIFSSIKNYDIETGEGQATLMVVYYNRNINGTNYVPFKQTSNIQNNLFITKK